ncbi:MAG: hypothetical protein Q8O00_13310 [Holophaga sp.]|nr:hypothetical protein [Holophaga sp.]
MLPESFVIGVVLLALMVLAILFAGRFTMRNGAPHRFRRTALLGIRLRRGSGLQGRSLQPPVRPGARDPATWRY